jgi:hypothetical protein
MEWDELIEQAGQEGENTVLTWLRMGLLIKLLARKLTIPF